MIAVVQDCRKVACLKDLPIPVSKSVLRVLVELKSSAVVHSQAPSIR